VLNNMFGRGCVVGGKTACLAEPCVTKPTIAKTLDLGLGMVLQKSQVLFDVWMKTWAVVHHVC